VRNALQGGEKMRALWKGYLRCSLVTIPVKIYNAVVDRSIHFVQLHKDCLGRIKLERVCSKCGKRLTSEEIVKGYQYGKDRYVIVTDEEIERAKRESSDVIEILRFVKEEEIPPLFYSSSHYLVPDGEVGAEAFALFQRAMKETGKCALAKIVWRNREQLLSISPYNGSFLAFTLHYAAEIQDLKQLEAAPQKEVDQSALEMAKALIEGMSGAFEPSGFRDEYTETLMQIIKAKAEGEVLEVAPKAEEKKVIDLMDALQKSLQAVGKGAEEIPKKEVVSAGGRRKATRRARKKA